MAEYIDREELIKALETDYNSEWSGVEEYVEGARDEYDDVLKIVCQQKAADVQPVKRGHWIEKSEEYYRLWQDSGRSWEDMPYFVTGLKFACPCCFNQYGVDKEGVEEWDFCPNCGSDMRGDTKC